MSASVSTDLMPKAAFMQQALSLGQVRCLAQPLEEGASARIVALLDDCSLVAECDVDCDGRGVMVHADALHALSRRVLVPAQSGQARDYSCITRY